MKYLFLTLFLSIIVSCETVQKKENDTDTAVEAEVVTTSYVSFGDTFNKSNVISVDDLSDIYTGLKVGDTVEVKFTSNVNSVCKKKGCWMKLDLSEDQETMVRFKDYSFFVPKNSEGRDVIVNGIAFLDQTSVEDLRHYAEDEGKSLEEIEAIVEPKINYSFTATGVFVEGAAEDFEGQVEAEEQTQEQAAE